MKVFLLIIVLGLIPLALLYSGSTIHFKEHSIDLHYSDTYVIISYLAFAILIAIYLLNLIVLAGLAGFRNRSFLIFFIITLLIDAGVGIYINRLFHT